MPSTPLYAKPLQLNTADAGFEVAFGARLHWSADTDAAIEQRVADILADVKARGDAAVSRHSPTHADSRCSLRFHTRP